MLGQSVSGHVPGSWALAAHERQHGRTKAPEAEGRQQEEPAHGGNESSQLERHAPGHDLAPGSYLCFAQGVKACANQRCHCWQLEKGAQQKQASQHESGERNGPRVEKH
jgi:hypothetical protein